MDGDSEHTPTHRDDLYGASVGEGHETAMSVKLAGEVREVGDFLPDRMKNALTAKSLSARLPIVLLDWH